MIHNDASELNDIHLARALKKASTPMFFVDKAGMIVWCNQAYADLLGRPMDQVLRHQAPSLTPSPEKAKFFLNLWQAVMRGDTWIGELEETKSDGSIVHVDAVFTPLPDANGRTALFLVLEHDITGRKLEYEKISHLANYDRLTGLSNRTFFTTMFERSITQSQRNGSRLAVFFIDLDGFKGVNDSLGHEAGDQVLIETANALQNFVRKSDVVARFGGDEFVCLLTDIESPESAVTIAQKMVDTISSITEIPLGKVNIGASIGVAIFPDHGQEQPAILAAADQAMYEAKRAGKRRVFLFDEKVTGNKPC
jgi:diguanylate cyclase (GGDEF)-like protein/PAS domain S-box-containing protein